MAMETAFHSTAEQREAFHRLLDIVIKDLGRGRTREQVVADLVRRGSTKEHAQGFVDHVDQLMAEYCAMPDMRAVVSKVFMGLVGLGVLWIFGGLIVALAMGRDWGYGAIVVGIADAVIGIAGRLKFTKPVAPQPQPQP